MRSFFYTLVVLFIIFVSSNCQDQDPNVTLPVPKFNHDVRFCGLPNDPNYNFSYSDGASQCDIPAYGKSLAKMALPAIIMFGFALLGSIALILFLCCPICNGYKRNKCVMFVALGIAIAFTITGLAVTQTGNVHVSRSVDSLCDTTIDTISTAIDIIDNVTTEIDDLPLYNEDFQMSLEEARNVFVEFNTSTGEIIDKINYYDDLRRAAMFVGSIIPTVLVLVGLILMLISVRLPLGILGWLCLFLSLFVWLSLAVHLVSAKVLSDLCWEIDLAMESGEAGPLTLIVKCNSEDGIVGNLRSELTRVLNEAITEGCNSINDACDNMAGQCGSYICEDEENIFSVVNITINDAGEDRTILECSESCTTPILRDNSRNIVDSVQLFRDYYAIALKLIEYIDCQFIVDAFNAAKDSICEKLVFGMQQIFAGNALLGIGMVIGCFTLVHIFKGKKKRETDDY